MARWIGIDLGTTSSVMAVVEGGEAVVIPNAEGSRLTPSVVAFPEEGEPLVGEAARKLAVLHPESTIFSIKRLLGRRFSEVQEECRRLPYCVVSGPDGMPRVVVQGREHTPTEITALILQKLAADAEAFLGEEVRGAVMAVPACWGYWERWALQAAAWQAGLEVQRMADGGAMAGLAYHTAHTGEARVLVYDLGGGSFNAALIDVGEGMVEVWAADGSSRLGGDEWAWRLISRLADRFQDRHGVDLRQDRQALPRLLDAAGKAMADLSFEESATVHLPYLHRTEEGPVHLEETVSRAEFEEWTASLLQSTRELCERVRKAGDGGPGGKHVDYVLLVGAATRMPMVARLLEASNMAHALSRGVHTEEAAALGAAIEGGILSGIIKDKVVTATVPHSLGIETAGNTAFPVIERDSLFPTAGRQSFTTATNGQTEVEIRILEGEGDRASDNRVLGSFRLSGVPPERAGLRTLEVTFDIDANGRLTVAALDLASGIQGGLTLSGRGSPPAESPPDLAAQIVPAEGAEVQQLLRAVRGLVSDGRLPLVSQERYQLNADMVRAEEVLKEGDEKQQARAVKALRKSLALFLEAVRKEQRKAEAGALSQEPAREEDGA